MSRFNYIKGDFGKYIVQDTEDEKFNINVFTEVHAIVLCDYLNKFHKKIEYQERVIDKCIKNEIKYKSIISDANDSIELLEDEVSLLNKEKRILKKIIHENMNTIDFLKEN